MKLFLTIVLNCFIATAIVYLIILIVDVTFVISFSSIMKHHAHDLTVILTNKRDNLAKLAENMLSHGIKIDKKKADAIINFDSKRLEIKDDDVCKEKSEHETTEQIGEPQAKKMRQDPSVSKDSTDESCSDKATCFR